MTELKENFKTINGRRFTFKTNTDNKRDAKQIAAQYRKKCYNVRIIEDRFYDSKQVRQLLHGASRRSIGKGKGGKEWQIWVSKRKKC